MPAISTVSPIRMVLFDFGNVLAHIDHCRFVRALMTPLGLIDETRIEELKNRLFGPGTPGELYESGQIPTGEFRRQAEAVFGRSWPIEVFDAAFSRIIHDPIPETVELLEWLAGKVRLGLLSNTSALHFDWGIRPHPAFPLFDQVSLSFQVGAMKPDPRMFHDALGKFGGRPEEILYLDDIPAYVDQARTMGMAAHVFTDPVRDCASVRSRFAPNLEVL